MDRLFQCATEDVLGNLFEMSYNEIVEKKAGYYRCKECLESGQAYIIQQYTQFLSEYDEASIAQIPICQICISGYKTNPQFFTKLVRYYGEKITPSLYYKADEEEYSEEKKNFLLLSAHHI